MQPDRAYVFDGYVLLDNPGVKEAFLRVSWYTSDDASGSAVATADSTERLTGSDPSFRYLTTGAMLVPQGDAFGQGQGSAGARIFGQSHHLSR